MIAVPAAAGRRCRTRCAAAGVRALVVLSAGFAEVGAAGARLQAELLAACRTSGHAARRAQLPRRAQHGSGRRAQRDASRPARRAAGRIAFASQSGAFGIAAIAEAARARLGLSSFVSTGNKADLSGNDFLRYWEQDARHRRRSCSTSSPSATRAASAAIARAGSPRASRSWRSRAAARPPARAPPSSHTGALLAASDVTVDALFAHAGVIRTDDRRRAARRRRPARRAAAAARRPRRDRDQRRRPRHRRAPTPAPPPACESSRSASATRRAPAPPSARPRGARDNPVDMIASATRRGLPRARSSCVARRLRRGRRDRDLHPAAGHAGRRRRGRDPGGRAATAAAGTPLLAVFMAVTDAERAELASRRRRSRLRHARGGRRAPSGTRALRRLARRRRRTRRPTLDALTATRRPASLARALGAGGGWLAPADVERVLRRLRHPARRVARRDQPRRGRAARRRARRPGWRSRRSRPGSCTRPTPAPCALDLGGEPPRCAPRARWRAP